MERKGNITLSSPKEENVPIGYRFCAEVPEAYMQKKEWHS